MEPTNSTQTQVNQTVPETKNNRKNLIIAGTTLILLALGAMAYLWHKQVNDLRKQNTASAAKIEQLEKQAATQATNQASNTSDKTYLEIKSWGVKFDNNLNLTYVIDKVDGKDRLLLTTSDLKNLVTDKCPGAGSGAIYPASITRSKIELTEADGVEFMENLGTFDGYHLYLSYSKEPCSTDPTEVPQRLAIYNAAKTIFKL